MEKKKIIIIAIFAIIFAGVTFFLLFKVFSIAKAAKENIELTKQMSPTLLEMMKQKRVYDFPYLPAPIQWEGRFLQVDDGVTPELLEKSLHFTYNRQRNEMLDTHRFLSEDDINGLVWLNIGSERVGQYKDGGYASQPYYVLSFLDLKRLEILSRDTVWGGMPPEVIHKSDNGGIGKLPKEEEVIKLIKERTMN